MIIPTFTQVRLPGTPPIFVQDRHNHARFYAPGYLAVVGAEHVEAFEQDLIAHSSDRWPEVNNLHYYARAAQRQWADIIARAFAPVCLTLYLNNECNLHCSYCYSMPSAQQAERLTLPVIQSAAEIVAANCQAQGRPLTVVFHGGGEPTLHRRVADAILAQIRAKVIVVDFHAEATSEKVAMGWHLDGRVTAVLGTHTHIPTADERVLPGGTAYQTDVGMTGPYDSVIGVETQLVLRKFLTGMPSKFEASKANPKLCAALVTCDPDTGRATHIQRIMLGE